MKYAHIIAACASELWAMQPETLHAMVEVLAFQAAGGKLSAEELEAKISKGAEREVAKADGNVALLPLRGIISNRAAMVSDVSSPGGTSAERFGQQFTAAVRDDGIKAIVLDVDTPGGAVSGVTELSQMIHDARGKKPIVAHVNASMGSAGYWIGSGADEIVVTPSGSVGSIGVYGVHDDISEALKQKGISKTIISAGLFKAEANQFGPLSDEARAALQSRVDASYDSFVRDVARNRGVSLSKVRNGFGQGRMVDAEPAVTEGMADSIGSLDDTLRRFGASLFAPVRGGRKAFAPAREIRALDLSEIYGE